MRLPIARILALGCTVALSACGTNPPPPAIHASLVSNYVLGSGDELRVTVFGQSDLTNTYTVDKAGYISVPLIGGVPVRGRTSATIEKDIADRLRKNYIRNPDVSVEVSKYRAIFVMGEVASGGQYSYVPGLTVQQAVAIAGGFGPRAARNEVLITRQKNGEVYNQPAVLSDPVYPGDTITVRERFF
jgi:polysaccharide export outer membrane protein